MAALLGAGLALGAALALGACQVTNPTATTTSATPLPTLSAAQLQGLLPEQVRDITFQAFAMDGATFLEETADPQFIGFLEQLGASPDDVVVAFAFGANADGTQTATVLAFRVQGADARDLVAEFQSTGGEGGTPLTWHERTIGGKKVQVADPTADFPSPAILYAWTDVMFFVTSTDQGATDQILRFLP